MNEKMILGIFLLIFLLSILMPTQTSAISSSDGYTIDSYNIEMIVNENNSFDITETINVNFTGNGKHGIFWRGLWRRRILVIRANLIMNCPQKV